MNRLILKIYDFFRKAPVLAWGLFLILTVALVCSILTLSYKEDISDFLPLDEKNQTALSIYQDVSGANKIYAIISTRDTVDVNPQELADGIELFAGTIENIDSLHYIKDIMKEVDMDKMLGIADLAYENIPYFLTDNDYQRIDSLLANPEYVSDQIAEDKQLLLFPSSNILTANISRDPLNLFTPILGRLKQAGMSIEFDTYDGYILTPDSKKAIVILESSFGAHESENNAALVSLLDDAKTLTENENNNLDIHIIGGPVIAVSNANQIKTDSILAVCIAGILIMLLLIYVFRNLRNILLIVVSVGWGWLFAMGAIALYYDSVSIIVIGIASVILGIAVNYPLHLIDHLKESDNPRSALKEIISPLVVGNVTTVGAFLCLVPLNSPALHDLGLFSSLLLIGTILFVLLFLPHIVKTRKVGEKAMKEPILITRLAGLSIENNKWAVWFVLIMTIVFGYFSLKTEFDSDMRNINYMSDEQKDDMVYFQSLLNSSPNTESLYIVSSGSDWEDALKQKNIIQSSIDNAVSSGVASKQSEVSSFLVSKHDQQYRLDRWHKLISKYKHKFTDELNEAAVLNGFNAAAFSDFDDIINKDYEVKDFDQFKEFISTVFVGCISEDSLNNRKSLVQVLSVSSDSIDSVKESLAQNKEFGGLFFDVKSMNGSIANTLSDDFNYIGIACGFIVFIFLWISLGSIELAIVSFMPMAFSWIWILGIMGMLGIKFNIVNVILATFIFGQGDDYTIFMTEGLSYEFAYRKKLLASYKNSIVVSALIMFIGIGTLLFAKHPALRSLGEVTVVGMLSVVLMAYLFPPLIFNWLIKSNGKLRYRPITLKKVLNTGFCATVFFIQLISAYILGFFLFVLTKPTPYKRSLFHRYNCSVFRFDIKRMPGIHLKYINSSNEDFTKPAVIICNHQSILDSFCMMFVTPKVVLLANEHIKLNPIVGTIFKWSNFFTVTEGSSNIIEKLKPLIVEGFSIAVFPEGERPESGDTKIKRFHKGAFYIASAFNLDIVPIFFNGILQIMPKGSALSNGGTMYIEIGKRIYHDELTKMGDISTQSKLLRAQYVENLKHVHEIISTVKELSPVVLDRYRYKGRDIEISAKRTLLEYQKQAEKIQGQDKNDFVISDQAGQGELALLLALMYPDSQIYCRMESSEKREILNGCLENFVHNVHIIDTLDLDSYNQDDSRIYVIINRKDTATPHCEFSGAITLMC